VNTINFNTLNQRTTDPNSHPLIKQINEWEQESIAKIQQKAKELRQEIFQLATVHLNELSKKLQYLSEKLKEGREYDSFVETDLQDWKKLLDDLKTNLTSPSTFGTSRYDRNPLVQNVSMNLAGRNELFERAFDNRVRIEENGLVAIHETSNKG
jgi:chromosome segregation ATPase